MILKAGTATAERNRTEHALPNQGDPTDPTKKNAGVRLLRTAYSMIIITGVGDRGQTGNQCPTIIRNRLLFFSFIKEANLGRVSTVLWTVLAFFVFLEGPWIEERGHRGLKSREKAGVE